MADDDFEDELIRRAQHGEVGVAPLLVSLFGDRLLGYARGHAPDLSDADREQIVELAVEAGVRAMPDFDRTKGTAFSWFRQQIRYKTLDWRRRNPPMVETPDSLAAPPPAPIGDPTKRDRVRSALSRVPDDHRQILLLRSVEQLAYSEIALRLEINEDAARQRHKRALARLRAAMEENTPGAVTGPSTRRRDE